MNDEIAKALGFENAAEFFKLSSSVDISTPKKLAAFKVWQNNDGTKAGIEQLQMMTHTNKKPGKYDELCTQARESAQAQGAIVIIINGHLGSGFSVQGSPDLIKKLPNILQTMANDIRNESLDS